MSFVTSALAGVLVVVSLALLQPSESFAADSQQAASSSASAQLQPHTSAVATDADLSRAYMNCLIEVDKTMAALSGNADLKAVRIEAQSQRAFCDNRKRDCQAKRDSAECRTFISEFQQSVLVE
jgi:hypothetical protein